MSTYQSFSFIPPPQPVKRSSAAETGQGSYTLNDCSNLRPDGTEVTTTVRSALDGQLIRPNHTAHHYVPSVVRTQILCPVNQQYIPVANPPAAGLSCHIAGQYGYGFDVSGFVVRLTARDYWEDVNTNATGSVLRQFTFTSPSFVPGSVLTPTDFLFTGHGTVTDTDSEARLVYAYTDSSNNGAYDTLFGVNNPTVALPSPTAKVQHRELVSLDEVTITYHGLTPTSEGVYPGFNAGQDYWAVVAANGAAVSDPVADELDAFCRELSEGYSTYSLGSAGLYKSIRFKGAPTSLSTPTDTAASPPETFVRLTDAQGNVDFEELGSSNTRPWRQGEVLLDPTPNTKPYMWGIRAIDNTNPGLLAPVTPVIESGGVPLDGVLGRVASTPNPNPSTQYAAVSAVGEGTAAFTDNTPLPPTGYGTFQSGGYNAGVVDVGVVYSSIFHSGFYAVSDLDEKAVRVQSVDVSMDNLQGLQVPTAFSQFPVTLSAHTVALYENGVPDQVSGDVYFPDLYDNRTYNRNTHETNVANVAFKGHSSSFKFGVWSLDAATWVLNTITAQFSVNTKRGGK